jgi:molybdate transport system ATP-binding protein
MVAEYMIDTVRRSDPQDKFVVKGSSFILPTGETMTLRVDIHKKLDHFTLRTRFFCHPGELLAIVGPSGAGKSSLIRIIAGLEAPDKGIVSMEGTTWADTTSGFFLPTCQRQIGMVFQEFTLFPHLSVRENIAFGAPDDTGLEELMRIFGIKHLQSRRPHMISGGERQRAAFCQALARRPRLLLLDEPFSALDVKTRVFLCSLLGDLKVELAIPILHVTHDLEEARILGDAIIAVENGKIAPGWLDDCTICPPRKSGDPSLQPTTC